MRALGTAFLVALALHAVFAVAASWYLSVRCPMADAPLPELDLSSVAVSVGEDARAPASPQTPAAEARAVRPMPSPRGQTPFLAQRLSDLSLPLPEKVAVLGRDCFKTVAKDLPTAPEDFSPQSVAVVREVQASVPSPPSCDRAEVIAPPALAVTFAPKYPKSSRRRGEEGCVVLRVDVAADGRVTSVSVAESSRFPALDEAAVAAVRRARFKPAVRSGECIAGRVCLPVEFRLK